MMLYKNNWVKYTGLAATVDVAATTYVSLKSHNTVTKEVAGVISFTGTPQGVILGEQAPTDQRCWLQPSDEVVSDIKGLSQLHVQLISHSRATNSNTNHQNPRKFATVDRLTVLTGGEAHLSDFSRWSSSVNEGTSMLFSNNVYLTGHGDD